MVCLEKLHEESSEFEAEAKCPILLLPLAPLLPLYPEEADNFHQSRVVLCFGLRYDSS